MRSATTTPLLAFGIALVAAQGGANAAGFQLFEQNASGLGNAYAGQAAGAEDASTIYFNPAGLTRLNGIQAVGALHFIKPETKFENTASCAPYVGVGAGTSACPFGPNGNLGHTPGGNGGDAGDLAAVPNAYFSWELLPRQLWLGLGISVPFGLTTEWDADWIGRFHAIKSEVQTINLNPTVAWKLSDMVSLGFGLNAQSLSAELSNAVSYRAVALASGIPALIAAVPAGSEGVATVEGDDWGWGWNAGVIFNFSPATRLGLSYRSGIEYSLDGDVTFANRPAALGAVPQLADGSVTADIELPATFSIAFSHEFTPAVQLLADWTWTGWDSIQDLTIVRSSGPLAGQTLTSTPLRFKNSWRAAVGANFQLNPAWKLRAGVAYDTSPVQDEFRTPRLPDADRTWLAVGGQWRFAPNAALDFGYAYIIIDDVTSNLANQESATSAPRGSLVGNYTANAHVLSAQIRWSF
ncbi:MAG TPA: outer membrane protein transport protein [Burkholderiaceae bacterium]|nr:outer membrane protein transport protein [Burkholderiaceae bacterium]